MTKKPRTPAQLANDKRLAEAARARRTAPELPKETVLDGTTSAPEPVTTYSDGDIAELIRQVQELKAQNQQFNQPQPQNTLTSNNGRLVGTVEKYLVDPKNYPDPTERLANEPKLARFAFPLNYELAWDVSVSSYQTIDGINQKEPRFTLQLVKVMLDEQTGEPTNKRAMLYQMMFHEDPQAAIAIAREHGLEVDEVNEKQFLDEMRYLRMRDWLFGLQPFYPQKAQVKKGKRQEVVGNRIVEVYETSGENAQSIPFGELNGKL